MVLWRLLLSLLNDDRVLNRLAEARPIRAAARFTAAALTRGLPLRDRFLRALKEKSEQAKGRGWSNQRPRK